MATVGAAEFTSSSQRPAPEAAAPRAAPSSRNASSVSRDGARYPSSEAAARLGAEGLLTLTAPRALGGGGAGRRIALRLIADRAESDAPAARLMAEANFGAMGAILRFADLAAQRRAIRFARAGAPPLIVEPGRSSCRAERRGPLWRVWGEAQGGLRTPRAAILLLPVALCGGVAGSVGRFRKRAATALALLDRDRDAGIALRHTDEGAAILVDQVDAPPERLLGTDGLNGAMALWPLISAERSLAEAVFAACGLDPARRARALQAIERAAAHADAIGAADPAECAAALALSLETR